MNNKKKIVFIRLLKYGKNYDSFKPLVFPIISKLTELDSDFEIQFIDEQVEKIPDVITADIIAFSVETLTAARAYKLAQKYKTENNFIIMGGFHPTILPDECLEYCDSIIIGDLEDTWLKFLHDYKNKTIQKKYYSKLDQELKCINHKFEYYKNKNYPKIEPVQFSRGCKFNCDFCSIKSMYKNSIRHKNIDDFVEEIKTIDNKVLFFVDDNLFLNKNVSLELFKKIKPLKKIWGCQISMDVAQNDELLKAMKDAGCVFVLIGFETINKQNLKQMNKIANLNIENYDKAIKNIYKYGLMICATFVFGYDCDTEQTIVDTVDFAEKYHFTKANFNVLTPFPGTKLYDRLKEEQKLIEPLFWLNEKFCYGDVIFKPQNITAESLKYNCNKARNDYYTYSNIFKRFFANIKYINIFNSLLFLYEAIQTKKTLKNLDKKRS